MNVFASRLKNLMKSSGTTQEQMAKVLGGISRQAVQQYTSNKAFPMLDKVILICKYFNISSDYLLGLSDKQKKEDI